MNAATERINYIDALRGVAIILSLEQHLGMWMADFNYHKHIILFGINGIGGFAGPLFVTLAGVSAYLFTDRNPACDATLLKRGLLIILYGYLLNILAPNMFSYGSWFVIHMIGFGIFTTPLFRRLSLSGMIVSALVILCFSISAQQWLNTPSHISWDRMNNMSMVGGVARLIFFEGHFPIFPWICFFIGGIVIGKLLMEQRLIFLRNLALICLSIAALIALAKFGRLDFAVNGPFTRIFSFYAGFYPASCLIFFGCFPLIIICLLLLKQIGQHVEFSASHPLICLGRTSLSLYLAHLIIGNWLISQGILPKFSPTGILPALFILIASLTLLSILWQKANYRYGPEWLLRKIT